MILLKHHFAPGKVIRNSAPEAGIYWKFGTRIQGMESGIQRKKFGIQGVESGIQRRKYGIQGVESGIQRMFGIQGVEIRIQILPGLSYMGQSTLLKFIMFSAEKLCKFSSNIYLMSMLLSKYLRLHINYNNIHHKIDPF